MTNFEDRFLRVRDVGEMFGIKPPTVWEWVRKGKLPKGRKLSARVTVWRLSDLLPYFERIGAAA